jgi:hypothetical protein
LSINPNPFSCVNWFKEICTIVMNINCRRLVLGMVHEDRHINSYTQATTNIWHIRNTRCRKTCSIRMLYLDKAFFFGWFYSNDWWSLPPMKSLWDSNFLQYMNTPKTLRLFAWINKRNNTHATQKKVKKTRDDKVNVYYFMTSQLHPSQFV